MVLTALKNKKKKQHIPFIKVTSLSHLHFTDWTIQAQISEITNPRPHGNQWQKSWQLNILGPASTLSTTVRSIQQSAQHVLICTLLQ